MRKWKTVKLGDVCVLNMGQSPDSSTYNKDKKGIPFFQGNADFGLLHPVTRFYCFKPTKIAHKDDILLSVRAPIGAINIAEEDCCIGRGLAGLTPHGDVAMKYLYYVLLGKNAELNFKGTGCTFKAINKKSLGDTSFPLPPLKEQKRIADILDKAAELISLRKQQLEKLDLLVKSQFIAMFGDPVTNEKGWGEKKLIDIASTRLGKMLDAKQQTGKHVFPYLANFNVQWFRFNLVKLNRMDFSPEDQIEFELKNGDLLICEGGEVGRTAIWRNDIEKCFFQKALHCVRCNLEIVAPEYLAFVFYIRATKTKFSEVVGGSSTISHLTGVKLKRLLIPIPPLELQNEFAAFVEKVEQQKALMQSGLEKLELNHKALMVEFF